MLLRIVRFLLKTALVLLVLAILYGAYVYIRYDEDLPQGELTAQADQLADSMLEALNYEAYQNTSVLKWTYRNGNRYTWDRRKAQCDVLWKEYKVQLELNNPESSKVYIHNFQVYDEQADELIEKALALFNNDSFWLVAPYKVYDSGTERRLVNYNGKPALLVTYNTGGNSPGDSYLWLLEESGKPYAFKMWVSALPVGGLEASWDDWIQVQSGAFLPQSHKLLFLNLRLGDVQGY